MAAEPATTPAETGTEAIDAETGTGTAETETSDAAYTEAGGLTIVTPDPDTGVVDEVTGQPVQDDLDETEEDEAEDGETEGS